MAVLVEAQGDMINQIEHYVVSAVDHTTKGVDQMKKAVKSQRKSRKKMCCLLFCLLFMIAIVSILVRCLVPCCDNISFVFLLGIRADQVIQIINRNRFACDVSQSIVVPRISTI